MSVQLVQRLSFLAALVADPDLSSTAKAVATALVAGFLNGKTGRCDPTYEALATATGLKRRATINAVQELQASSWVIIRCRGSQHRPNQFGFAFERAAEVHDGAPLGDDASEPGVHDGAPLNGSGVHDGAPLDRPGVHEKVARGAPPCTRTGEEPEGGWLGARERAPIPPVGGGFDRFWKAYPWKVAPGEARKRFEAIIDFGMATADELVAGAIRYAAVAKPGRTYAPTKWLEQERWADEAPAERPPEPARRGARRSSDHFDPMAYARDTIGGTGR